MRPVFASLRLDTLTPGDTCTVFPMSYEITNPPWRVYVSYIALNGTFRKLSPADNTEAAWLLWVLRERAARHPNGVDRPLFSAYGMWRFIYSSTYLGWVDTAVPVNMWLDVNEAVLLYYNVSSGNLSENYVTLTIGGYIRDGEEEATEEGLIMQPITMPYKCQEVIPGLCL